MAPRTVRRHIPPRLAASAVMGIGLLFALAATVGPLPLPTGEPGASLAVRLPYAIRTIVLVLLALSGIILLAVQRPRRPTDDDPSAFRAPQRRSAWAGALATLPLLVLLAVAWYLVWHLWAGDEANPIETVLTSIAELIDLLASSRKAPTSVPWFDLTIAALVLLLALTIFALMALALFADRLDKWWAGRAAGATAPLSDTIDESLDDLRAEPDPRAGIIRAWSRFEHAASVARAPRAPWQTPTEFMRATLARLQLPVTPVRRLTTLFEIARFSDRPLGAEARDAACDCLDEIRVALDENAARAR